MEYTCVEYVIDGQKKRCKRKLRMIGNSLEKEAYHSDIETSATVQDISSILRRTFLPVGYPNSVRPEYITYQLWDSVQGMSSYLRSVLTTRSILAGAGVGSAESTALAAALTWVFRDGIGMIGSLVFAYYYANAFEIYIKEWRYLADVLNNIGLTLDLVSSYFPDYYFALTSISTLCKACCGLIAGATKARISAHFALPGHLADVTAKESTQETAVALCGLIIGMMLAQLIGNDDRSVWITFLVLLCLHQYANYRLVRVLVFNSLNPQRCWCIAHHTMGPTVHAEQEPIYNTLPPPRLVAAMENFTRPFFLTYLGPEVGGSLSHIADTISFLVCNRSGTFIDQSGLRVSRERRVEGEGAYASGGPDSHSRARSIVNKNVCTFFAALVASWPSEEFIIGVNMNGRVIASLREGISATGICKAYLISYFVHIKLNSKIALYVANFDSKFSYLTEVYEYLVGSVAAEALRWYEKLDICVDEKKPNNKKSQAKGTTTAQARETGNEWNLSDISSLYIAPWRYDNLQKVKDGEF